jgi:hypothetical protein
VSFLAVHQIDWRLQPVLAAQPVSWPPDPIEIYASAIDTSDYAERLGALVRRVVPAVGDLLDIGAGGGQLGWALRGIGRRWTAVEPNPNMHARLARLGAAPHIIRCGWEKADVGANGHDTVLAASIAAPFEEPGAFLSRCLAWTRQTVVWIVPAHRGPRGLVFAGCLPAEWHGEDETPGFEIVLGKLPTDRQPRLVATTEWTFSGVFADLDRLANYLGDRLGWTQPDPRRQRMVAHLMNQAKPHPAGYRLEIPRKSAVLVWGKS